MKYALKCADFDNEFEKISSQNWVACEGNPPQYPVPFHLKELKTGIIERILQML
jgi:hypothetical protein